MIDKGLSRIHVASPRIYCLPATKAPIAAVFRRGPTDWSHVGRWDLAARRYEPGAWLPHLKNVFHLVFSFAVKLLDLIFPKSDKPSPTLGDRAGD